MNETDKKLELTKGKVSQSGYDDAFCTFIKPGEGRNDSLSNKALYIAEDKKITDDMYVVTPSVTESLNRVPRKTLGIMNSNGELLVPCTNVDVVTINNKYLAVKTREVNPEINSFANEGARDRILDTNINVRFICEGPEEIYDLYKVQDKTLLKVDEQISYIAVDGDTVYTKNNNINEEVQVFGNKLEEPDVKMPIGALADVTDKPLDRLDVENVEEVKDGAPDLVNEEEVEQEMPKSDHFDISEIQNDLNEINNDFEKSFDFDTPVVNTELEVEQEEKTEIEEKPKIEFEEKEEVKEPEEKFSFEREKVVKEDKPVGNLNTVVSAVKEKMSRLQDELTEKEENLEDKEKEISKKDRELDELNRKLEEMTNQLEENNERMKSMEKEKEENESKIITMENKLEEKDSKIAQYQKTMGDIYSEFSEMLDNSDDKKYYKVA